MLRCACTRLVFFLCVRMMRLRIFFGIVSSDNGKMKTTIHLSMYICVYMTSSLYGDAAYLCIAVSC